MLKKIKENLIKWGEVAKVKLADHASSVSKYIKEFREKYRLDEKLRTLSPFRFKEGPEISLVLGTMVLILILFLGGFLFWAIFGQLDSAAIASGKVIVSTHRKIIQHKEGGIIDKILVKDGDLVQKGQVLILLDETEANSRYNLLQEKYNALLAIDARLVAERDHHTEIVFPEELTAVKDNKRIQEIMVEQKEIFLSNRETYEGQVLILTQKIHQLQKEIESISAQVKSENRQLELVKEEEEAVAELEKKKLVKRPRLLALRRELARLEGNRGEHLALIARAEQKIGETKQQLLLLKSEERNKVLEKLHETQIELADLRERLEVASDQLERVSVRSPEPGIVFNLKFHTVGGVIAPATPIMDIVPIHDKLIIEAHVSPLDIDVVRPGLEATVQLTPFKQRRLLQIKGTVISISADISVEPQTNKSYYIAYVEIPKEELAKAKGGELYPGMPVQVLITTGKRSPFEYFFIPVKESFQRAFRED